MIFLKEKQIGDGTMSSAANSEASIIRGEIIIKNPNII